MNDFRLDFGPEFTGFFTGDKLTCDITGVQTGRITIGEGRSLPPHSHIGFTMVVDGIDEFLTMRGTIGPGGDLSVVTENPPGDGLWGVSSSGGRSRSRKGCTGNGGDDDTGIVFTVTAVACGPLDGQEACAT